MSRFVGSVRESFRKLLHHDAHEFGAGADASFSENLLNGAFDGSFGNAQACGDLFVRVCSRNSLQYLSLPLRKGDCPGGQLSWNAAKRPAEQLAIVPGLFRDGGMNAGREIAQGRCIPDDADCTERKQASHDALIEPRGEDENRNRHSPARQIRQQFFDRFDRYVAAEQDQIDRIGFDVLQCRIYIGYSGRGEIFSFPRKYVDKNVAHERVTFNNENMVPGGHTLNHCSSAGLANVRPL